MIKQKILVQDRNTGETVPLSDLDFTSFSRNREKNNAYQISFSVNYSTSIAYSLLQYENYLIFDGEMYVLKQGTDSLNGDTIVKQVTATHIFYELNNRRQYEVKAGEFNFSINSALEFLFKNIGQGYTYEIHGIFSDKKMNDFGNCSVSDGLSTIKDVFGVYGIYPYNKTIHLYDRKSWCSEKSTLVAYRHNAPTASLQWDSMSIVNRIQVVSSAEKPLFSPFYVQDDASVKRWGIKDGDRYENDIQNAEQAGNQAKQSFVLEPVVSLSLTVDSSLSPRLGDVLPVKIPYSNGEYLLTNSEVISVTDNPLIENGISQVVLNNNRKTFLDTDRSVRQQLQTIKREVKKNATVDMTSWVVGEVVE